MTILQQRYVLKKVIGQGGMGRVYSAYDQEAKNIVAIKECFIQDGKTNIAERIQREYCLMQKFKHPNIIEAFDFFFYENKYFIVMEYLEGFTLDELIKHKRRSIDFSKQLEIAIQICQAVNSLNQNEIIHRDLKPSNIMLINNDYTVKILDLGIAKSVEQELTGLTNTGDIIGTPMYMSPEQIMGDYAMNSDVFSVGVILYQFFSWSDKSPFYATSAISSMDRVINLKLPPIKLGISYRKYLSKLTKILSKTIHKDHNKRLQNIQELYNVLNWIYSDIKRQKAIRKTIDIVGTILVVIVFVVLGILQFIGNP